MDDLLIPTSAAPSQAVPSGRPMSGREPANVLSLFDQPKPVPPPKPAKPVMMGGDLMMGPPPGSLANNTGPQSAYSPAMRGGAAPAMGGLSPGYAQGAMSGGRGLQQQQQQQMPFSPQPHMQHQQPFSPAAGMQQRPMQSFPVIQTNKSVDPFDSIGQQQMGGSAKRR